MTDKSHRSAITGKFVTADHAAVNLDTTVSESPCAECERLRGVVRGIRAYCEAFVEESEDSDPEPWNPAAYVLSILDHDPDDDHDANSNSKAQLGVGLEPIVRTVGDLTARHIGRRVRLDEYYDGMLETIFAHHGGYLSLNFTHPEGFTYGCSRPLDTPCEVLP